MRSIYIYISLSLFCRSATFVDIGRLVFSSTTWKHSRFIHFAPQQHFANFDPPPKLDERTDYFHRPARRLYDMKLTKNNMKVTLLVSSGAQCSLAELMSNYQGNIRYFSSTGRPGIPCICCRLSHHTTTGKLGQLIPLPLLLCPQVWRPKQLQQVALASLDD